MIIVTLEKEGSWSFTGNSLLYLPAWEVRMRLLFCTVGETVQHNPARGVAPLESSGEELFQEPHLLPQQAFEASEKTLHEGLRQNRDQPGFRHTFLRGTCFFIFLSGFLARAISRSSASIPLEDLIGVRNASYIASPTSLLSRSAFLSLVALPTASAAVSNCERSVALLDLPSPL